MNILVVVFFKAPSGGLHENIRSTLISLMTSGSKCTVVCKDGVFSNQLNDIGINTICTDFTEKQNSYAISKLNKLNEVDPFSLIHTHPFFSRSLAQNLSKLWNCPLVTTIHGMYTDKLEENHNDFSAIFAVSTGIRDFLIEKVGNAIAAKTFVFPNSVNFNQFNCLESLNTNFFNSSNSAAHKKIKIALISRLDLDKKFIIEIFIAAIKSLVSKGFAHQFCLLIVGEGSERESLIDSLCKLIDPALVEFTGWLTNDRLANAYHQADIVVAPGRCALESMACCKPTIAIGSKCYIGIIDEINWMNGVYSNFGGTGKVEDYKDGQLADDLIKLMSSSSYQRSTSELGREITSLFYDEDEVNSRILSTYKLLIA